MGLSKNIAYRLRTLREAAGLSQQEVADRADLSLSLITKMEQARKADPRASTILALAAALGVRPGQLIEDLTPPPEGVFPDKKKGKKKKQKKLLATLAASVVVPGGGANGSGAQEAPSADGASGAPDSPDAAHAENGKGKKKRKTK